MSVAATADSPTQERDARGVSPKWLFSGVSRQSSQFRSCRRLLLAGEKKGRGPLLNVISTPGHDSCLLVLVRRERQQYRDMRIYQCILLDRSRSDFRHAWAVEKIQLLPDISIHVEPKTVPHVLWLNVSYVVFAPSSLCQHRTHQKLQVTFVLLVATFEGNAARVPSASTCRPEVGLNVQNTVSFLQM